MGQRKRYSSETMTTLTQTDDTIVTRVEAAGERIQRVQKAASAVIELRDFDASKQQSAKPFFSSDMSPSQPSF